LPVIVAPLASSRLVTLAAAAWAALAACLSFGAIAFTGASSPAPGADVGARIGVLLLDATHLAIAGLAAIAVLIAGLSRDRPDPSMRPLRNRGIATAIAVSPLALVFLPWLPFRVPAAFLMWTGPLMSVVWLAVAIGLVGVAARSRCVSVSLTPERSAMAAGVVSFVIFSVAAWAASPALPFGDEPHYLVVTQSLLYDGDLKIENNHRRGDFRAYFDDDLPPHVIRNGRNGEMYSIHSPGLPAMILPAFAIGGYRGAVVFLLLVASAACALAWWLAWRTTGSQGAAWFGWAAVTLSAPFLLESYTVFPDGPGAALVLTGFWALLRADWEAATGHTDVLAADHADHTDHAEQAGNDRAGWLPWLLHGAALAALPWMHTRFAVLAATLGGLILVRLARTANPFGKATAFLAVPAVSALAWLGFFLVVYGTPDPTAPYGRDIGSSFAFLPNGLGGLLFDQGFGLLATAPVLAVALAGFAHTRRVAIEWLVVAVPYLFAVGTYAMWWAGVSGPARFLVPLVLPLALPAACAWVSAKSHAARIVMLSALVVSAWLSAVMAGGGDGRLSYHTRNETGMTAAPWLEWANHVVDLPSAFPAFVPRPLQPDPRGLVSRMNAVRTGLAATVPWTICLGAGILAIVGLARRSRRTETLVAGATVAFACAAMIAMTIVWKLQAAEPLTVVSAQMEALRRIASPDDVALDLTSHRRFPKEGVAEIRVRIPIRRGARGTPRGLNRPLAVFQSIPAGSYVLSAVRHGTGDGWVMAGVGNDQFAIVTRPIADFDAGVRIELPAGAGSLSVRADEAGRDQLDGVELAPIALDRSAPAVAAPPRAVRYGEVVVFFLDERAFPDPSGFWVGGARQAAVMLTSDRPEAPVPLILHNGAVDNSISLEFAGRREEIALRAGEERRIEVPLDPRRGAALVRIRSASAFRPSDVDPASRDTRRLGVYVRF
jgi:hypothetical protein